MEDLSERFLESLSKVCDHMEKTDDGRSIRDDFMDVTSEFLAQLGMTTVTLFACVDMSKNVLTLMNHLIEEVTNLNSTKESLERLKVRADSVIDQMRSSTANLPIHVRKNIDSQLNKFVKVLDVMIRRHTD